jgi:RNA polymerase sigma-70 factor (ECF subfamily)
VAESDVAAIERDLVPRFWERLRVFALRRLGDAAQAEDLAQEALRRTTSALREGRVDSLDALPAFVFQTATHLCLHHYRARGREKRALAQVATTTDGVAPDPHPLDGLVSDEARAAVRGALSALGADDRRLLNSLYFEQVEPTELARQLGITPGALRVRKHRAHARLAELLGEWRL